MLTTVASASAMSPLSPLFLGVSGFMIASALYDDESTLQPVVFAGAQR